MGLFCSAEWEIKRVQNTWHFSWLFFVWLFPTTIPHSRERSKGWTSGAVIQDKKYGKLIWREKLSRIILKSAQCYFLYKQFWLKDEDKTILVVPRDVTSSLILVVPVLKNHMENLELTATQFNIQTLFDWWDLNIWNWTFFSEGEWSYERNSRTFKT